MRATRAACERAHTLGEFFDTRASNAGGQRCSYMPDAGVMTRTLASRSAMTPRPQRSGLPKILPLFAELLPQQRFRPEHMGVKVLRNVLRQGRL